MAMWRRGNTVFFYNRRDDSVLSGVVESVGSKNTKVLVVDSITNKRTMWKVYNGYIGLTEQEARKAGLKVQEESRERKEEREERKFEAASLYFRPKTMIVFRSRGR